MLTRLLVHVEPRALTVVGGLCRSYADALALEERERESLIAVVADAVRFVVDHAYAGGVAGEVEVALDIADDGVRVAIHDWGRPLISASAGAPELPAELARLSAIVRDLRLINLGAQGKRLTFVWPVEHALPEAAAAAEVARSPGGAAAAVEVAVRDATPDDAEQIAQLVYDNYALSYAHPDFYRPRWVREQIAARRVLSTVAVHAGAVVGHHALLPAAGTPSGETGVAVVANAYRGLGIFGRLEARALERAAALGLAAVYGQAVTVHPYSQRAELAHGYRETALCLGALPARMTMRGSVEVGAGRRTAAIVSFRLLRADGRRATLPSRYRDRLIASYRHLGLPAPAQRAEPGRGGVTVHRDADFGFAVMRVAGWDGSVAAAARSSLRRLLAEHVDVLYADLDLASTTNADAAVEALREKGFSYAGLWPSGVEGHDHLRLQHLNCTNVELERIATASPAAEELRAFVLSDLRAVGDAV